MSQNAQASSHRLRRALANDPDGTWTSVYAAELRALSASVSSSAINVVPPDLRGRCEALARAARVGAELLPALRERLAPEVPHVPVPHANAELLAQTTQTSTLYELGWLAIEGGLSDEGLVIVESVGTLLHGLPGGVVFRVESLLAMGRPVEAAKTLEDCLGDEVDPHGMVASNLAALWAQRSASSLAGPPPVPAGAPGDEA